MKSAKSGPAEQEFHRANKNYGRDGFFEGIILFKTRGSKFK